MINRFEWLKAVLQSDILDRAKVLASALAIQFGNDETGQINPALDTLATYLRTSEDTVRRALADLIKTGWLARTVGMGRGNRSAYVLLSPGSVVALRPAQGGRKATEAPKQKVARVQSNVAGKGRTAAAKRSHGCNSHIMQEQSSEQRKGARPSPHLSVRVAGGSWQALEWNKWLSDEGERIALADLKALHVPGGYDLPWSVPPRQNPVQRRIALNVIAWARGQGHEHAA